MAKVYQVMEKLKNAYPALHDTLTLPQLTQFCALAGSFIHQMKDIFPTTPTSAPIEFLSQSLPKLRDSRYTWARLWKVTFHSLYQCPLDTGSTFSTHGLISNSNCRAPDAFEIPQVVLGPPTMRCLSTTCLGHQKGRGLRSLPHLQGYLYDLDGVKTVFHQSKYCRYCHTNYRHTYYTHNNVRYYYTEDQGLPLDIYQVQQHYFITRRLVHQQNMSQMLSHTSIFNLVNIYNATHGPYQTNRFQASFGPTMTASVCRHGLDVHRLLHFYVSRKRQLQCPATGMDYHRFDEAMQNAADILELEGSPYRSHVCSHCTTFEEYYDGNGQLQGRICRAMVTDGVTIGHWCCSATRDQLAALAGLPSGTTTAPCFNPLKKVNDRFCPLHEKYLLNLCIAQPCDRVAGSGQPSCDLPAHIEAVKKYRETLSSSGVGLKNVLKRPGALLPVDPTVHLDSETAEIVDIQVLQQTDEADRAHESVRDGGVNVIKTVVGRKKTHNEQLVVSPCGIILGRRTFFRAESVTAVCHFLRDLFLGIAMPSVSFYDNNCNAEQHVKKCTECREAFKGTILPVDAFHFKSHAETHAVCRLNNDPNLFPQLKTPDGGWVFNSSAAEMTNVWFGGFASMCRNMRACRYNFFLDEMIRLRNLWMADKLRARSKTHFFGYIDFVGTVVDYLVE